MVRNLDRLNKLNNKLKEKIDKYDQINDFVRTQGLVNINSIDMTKDKEVQSYVQDAILVSVQRRIRMYKELAEKLTLNEEDLEYVEEWIDRI